MTGEADRFCIPVKFCIPLSYFVPPKVGLVLLVFQSHVCVVFFTEFDGDTQFDVIPAI